MKEAGGKSARGYVTVVGAAGIDIGGASKLPLISGDSNPGKICSWLGGVGRNIAHNLRLLGLDVELVTVLGDDPEALRISSSSRELGIGISATECFPGETTSVYLFITGPDGDMALALNDMDVTQKLTPEYLEARRELICGSNLIVLDTNIPQDSIGWLAENCRVPLFADPVSVNKAKKLKPYIGAMHTIKPNLIEAELLSGIRIRGEEDLHAAANRLLSNGLERVFISLGPNGVFAAERGRGIIVPPYKAKVINATGAGDALMAALAWSYIFGLNLVETGRVCQAAACVALQSVGTINTEMSVSLLDELANIGMAN